MRADQTTYQNAKRVLIELIPLFVLVVLPFSVNAGVFATFIGVTPVPFEESTTDTDQPSAQNVSLLKAALHSNPNPAKGGGDIIIEEGALVPDGDIRGGENDGTSKAPNGEILFYKVLPGDTPSQIADMFDISVNTILWANNIKNANLIRPGDDLVILPISGISHVVKKGDTLASIVKKYDGDLDEVIGYNQLASAEDISVGDTVVIPGGAAPVVTKTSKPAVAKGGTTVSTGSGSAGFVNPLPGAVRTQGIHGYNGVDLAAPVGTTIRAAAAGEVIVSKSGGYNGGYGSYVVIKHANGTQTLYAHMSSNAVSVGDSVAAGQAVGAVGNTGRSTGSHLHFEVRGARNPF